MAAGPPSTQPEPANADRIFRAAAAFYLIAWSIHTADHIRRGTVRDTDRRPGPRQLPAVC